MGRENERRQKGVERERDEEEEGERGTEEEEGRKRGREREDGCTLLVHTGTQLRLMTLRSSRQVIRFHAHTKTRLTSKHSRLPDVFFHPAI